MRACVNERRKIFRRVLALVVVGLGASASAQVPEPLNPPVPFVQAPGQSAGQHAVALDAAIRAQNLGLSSIAAGLYRQLLETPGGDRERLTLALATALLDAGRADEAEQALATLPEPRGATWQLRAGLAALQLKKRDAAQAAWDGLREAELPPPDRAWYWFLAGALWDTAAVRNLTEANRYYLMAEGAATTDLAKARFQLAAEQVRLQLPGVKTEADLKAGRDNYERQKGTPIGYSFAEAHAIALSLLGRQRDAVNFLQAELIGLPRQERVWWDKLRLDLGLIGDRTRNGSGRNALVQLLASGYDRERQRQALQLLAEASRAEPERGHFRAELNRLIGLTPPHSIRESLLFYRAQLALSEGDYVQAERDANLLLKDFPGSPLRAHAYGVLTQSAWEQRRYRTVADNARRARAELPGTVGRARADLGILEAEAWFRAEDYRSAADAYAAVLRERPAGIESKQLGELMFQRVVAEINSGSGQAASILDQLSADPAFDVENRWQAEWHLARALRRQGATAEAYDRVTRLLGNATGGASAESAAIGAIQPELKARMAWLQARLSFEAGAYDQTLGLVATMVQSPLTVDEALKKEISSDLILLRGRAELAAGREEAALESFNKLRGEFPNTDAAIYSYLVLAGYYGDQDQIAKAQQQLARLTDNPAYEKSVYVPYALFQLALLSERLRGEKNYEEANRRIEQLVNSAAAADQPDLIFAARLKQGDLFRLLNDFPRAQRAYEDLVNRYPRRPDVVLAQLRLAQTHHAQRLTDPAHAEIARLKFEELRDRVDAPPDVRVEAGYNLGLLLEWRGQPERAMGVWWDVVNAFLVDDQKGIEPGAKRPFWLASTLLSLGELLEKQQRIDEARTVYRLLLDRKLGHFEAVAKANLERLGQPTAKL